MQPPGISRKVYSWYFILLIKLEFLELMQTSGILLLGPICLHKTHRYFLYHFLAIKKNIENVYIGVYGEISSTQELLKR